MALILRVSFLFVAMLAVQLNVSRAQFGVPREKQKANAPTFEQMNEMAQDQYAGIDINALGEQGDMMRKALGEMGNFDMNQWAKMMEETLKDPQTMEMIAEMSKGMGDLAEQLKTQSPDEIVKNAMDVLNSGSMFDGLKENMDEVLANLEASGMIPQDKMMEYKADPDKFKKDLDDAMGMLGDLFKDPAAMDAAASMLKGFSEVMEDPEKMMEQFNRFAAEFSQAFADFDDDDKIEEARLQLLDNPELAGDPTLASVFSSDEMKEILNDPVKWRESVKKGQGLLNQAAA